MKTIKSKMLPLIALSVLVVVPLIKGNSFKIASASDELVNVKDKYFKGNNCIANTYLNKEIRAASGSGFVTELIPTNGSTNISATFKQTIKGAGTNTSHSSNAENMFAFEKYTTPGGSPLASADMIVLTYKSLKDPSKSLSLINHVYGGKYNSVTVSFTEDIELRDDTVYIAGTNQPTIGKYQYGKYNSVGCIPDGEYGGALFGTSYYYVGIFNDEDGRIQHNDYRVYADILSDGYLEACKDKLDEDSPYRDLYTKEYASDLLNALSEKSGNFGTTSLTITYYGIKVSEPLAFRMTQVDNQWIGLNNAQPKEPTTTLPFTLQKVGEDLKPIKLCEGISYSVDQITDVYNTHYENAEPVNWREGWTNASEHTSEFYFTENNIGSKALTPSELGKEKVAITVTTRCNTAGQSWSDRYLTLDLPFDVVEGNPEVTSNGDVAFLKDTVYDLLSFFTYKIQGNENEATFDYYIDDLKVDRYYVADEHDHIIKLEITDSRGKKASSTCQAISGTIYLPERVETTAYVGMLTFLPVPEMNVPFVYTLKLFKDGEELSDEIAYVFQDAGTYNIKYYFEITETVTVMKEVTLVVYMDYKTPTITINGEYKNTYILGQTVNFVDATASDGLNMYQVKRKLLINGFDMGEVSGQMQLTEVGEYKVVYSTTYGNNLKVTKEIKFNVVKDNNAPTLVISGSYAESYMIGTKIKIIDAVASEESGLTPKITVNTYFNENKITVNKDEWLLDKAGTYKVEYIATNFSGVSNRITVSFEVKNEAKKKKGCKGDITSNSIIIVGCAFISLIAFSFKKKED